jgi:uncharacterized DUF497 family protein
MPRGGGRENSMNPTLKKQKAICTDDGNVVRIISAREATHGERKSYEET